jgi:transposase-like protein
MVGRPVAIAARPHRFELLALRAQLDTVADMLGRQFPKVRAMLLEAKVDLTAFVDFPEGPWKKIQSTNPLERVNREIKRRIDVVQIFLNSDPLERLTTAVLIESTTNGSPCPAATSPTEAWTRSIQLKIKPPRLHGR